MGEGVRGAEGENERRFRSSWIWRQNSLPPSGRRSGRRSAVANDAKGDGAAVADDAADDEAEGDD